MVERFRIIVESLIASRGEVYLFAILKMDELVDKWSVILSAPWINDDNRREVFEEVRKLMIKELNTEELNTIARIGLLSQTEHLVDELLNFQPGAEVNDQKINGNKVHKGYVLESRRVLPDVVQAAS